MKKYLLTTLFAFSFFFALINVNAASTSQYTYDVTKATYTNTFTVTQLSMDGWIFNICNSSNYCKIIDATNLMQTAYGTFSLGDIDGITIVQGGNTADLYFEVYFKKYISSSATYYYGDYYEPRQYRLYMSTSYTDRRIVQAVDTLKSNTSNPVNSSYLKMQWRYVYNFATNSFNTLTAPSSSTSSFIQTNQTLIKINYSSYDIFNTSDGYAINSTLYYSNNWVSPIPDYLTGYKEVILSSTDKYVFISGVSSGSIYIPRTAFNEIGGKLSYYDKDIDSQPFSSVIQKYKTMSDNKYVRQDFDLSSYTGADFTVFNKYLYTEDNEDASYSIYVPENAYISVTAPVPNSDNGNDFDYQYQDENGVIQDGSYSSSSSDSWAVGRGIELLKEKLGFIAYPFTLIIDVLGRYLSISDGDGIIHIPNISDPIYGHILVNEQDFSLANIFNYGVIGTIYNIYLYLVDVIVIYGLVNLAKKKFDETIGEGTK